MGKAESEADPRRRSATADILETARPSGFTAPQPETDTRQEERARQVHGFPDRLFQSPEDYIYRMRPRQAWSQTFSPGRRPRGVTDFTHSQH